MIEKIKRRRLTLLGHLKGERSRGRQRKRWMDNVREDLEERDIQLSTAYMKKPRIEKFGEI